MKRKAIVKSIKSTDYSRIVTGIPPVAAAAFVTGNASGIHGGKKLKYSKRDRQRGKLEQRLQELGGNEQN